MRVSCIDCSIKHFTQAMILASEAMMGYPNHKYFVIGHLAEAADELIGENKELANAIRDVRLAYSTGGEVFNFDYVLGRLIKYRESQVCEAAAANVQAVAKIYADKAKKYGPDAWPQSIEQTHYDILKWRATIQNNAEEVDLVEMSDEEYMILCKKWEAAEDYRLNVKLNNLWHRLNVKRMKLLRKEGLIEVWEYHLSNKAWRKYIKEQEAK